MTTMQYLLLFRNLLYQLVFLLSQSIHCFPVINHKEPIFQKSLYKSTSISKSKQSLKNWEFEEQCASQ